MASDRPATELLRAGEEALVEAGFCTGDFTHARELVEAARTRAARDGNEELEAAASDRLGMVQHYLNITRLMDGLELDAREVDIEEGLFRRALAVREDRGDMAGMAQSMFGLGLVFQVLRRDWASAMPLFSRALEIVEELGDRADLYTRSEIHRHVGFYFLVRRFVLRRRSGIFSAPWTCGSSSAIRDGYLVRWSRSGRLSSPRGIPTMPWNCLDGRSSSPANQVSWRRGSRRPSK